MVVFLNTIIIINNYNRIQFLKVPLSLVSQTNTHTQKHLLRVIFQAAREE